MKVNFKKFGVEAEADVEKLIEKSIDNYEKDWQEKYNAKKELLELKHKHRMEEQNLKNTTKSSEKIEWEQNKIRLENEKTNDEKAEKKVKKIIKVTSIILFFVYGLFCITGFKDSHIVSATIGLIQVILVTISLFSSTNILSLFKNDYKICLIISLLLIIPWLAFAI